MKGYLRLTFLCGLAVMSVFWGPACEKAARFNDTTNTFSGTITDSATGAPIDSVRISLSDTTINHPSWYSDSTGSYQGVTFGGRINIFAQKAGYLMQSSTLDLNRDLTGVDFKLVHE